MKGTSWLGCHFHPAVPSGASYSSWPGCGDDSPHVDSASGSGEGGRGVGRDRLRAPKLPGLGAPAPIGVTAAGPRSLPPPPSLLQCKAGTNMASPGGGSHASLRHAGDTGLLMESHGGIRGSRGSRGSLCASDQGQGDTNTSLSRMLWKPGDGLSGSQMWSVEILCGSEKEFLYSTDSWTLNMTLSAL